MMVDLGLCGLLVSVLLFLAPAAIYLTFGLTCYGDNAPTQFCWNITQETATVLIAFGFVFLAFGTITCVFTMMIWKSNANSGESFGSDNKDNSCDLV